MSELAFFASTLVRFHPDSSIDVMGAGLFGRHPALEACSQMYATR
jgi:hypothetical protein